MENPEIIIKLQNLEKRIETLEIKMDYLFRNLGINYNKEVPEIEILEKIRTFLQNNDLKSAVIEFKEQTGASLTDAKRQIDIWKKELSKK